MVRKLEETPDGSNFTLTGCYVRKVFIGGFLL